MKVRTFALVIDGRKIDSCSGVQLGEGSPSAAAILPGPVIFFSFKCFAKGCSFYVILVCS